MKWADVIFVMETKHRDRLRATFTRLFENKTVHVLDIPDDYQYMDDELVSIFKDIIKNYLFK